MKFREMFAQAGAVAVTRGPRVESLHAIDGCAVDVAGRVVFREGAIDEPFYLRSAAKPFIAAAIVRAGAADRFGLDARELAVITASHGGESFHVAAVASILRKIGLPPTALRCGIHPPAYEPAAAALALRNAPPSQLHNNCSGKHAGILALALVLGAPVESYLDPAHPAQREILALCERVSDDRFGSDRIGVDGCGIPVYATSLRNAARSYARLATLTSLEDGDAAALGRVRAAMTMHPELVAGTGRFDTALMRASGGAIVAKAGAEGVQGCALVERGIGLVIKVVDGNRRATAPAALAALASLGALDASAQTRLEPFARVPVRNVAGRNVGVVEALPVPADAATASQRDAGAPAADHDR